MLGFLQIITLGLIQGAAELLPISSSAHVIVAEKLMGIDPTSPQATFVLIMLHTGTMFAVLVYFWPAWRQSYFSSQERLRSAGNQIVIATCVTGILGLGLQHVIVRHLAARGQNPEVEELFGRLPLIAAGLAIAGLLILISARKSRVEGDETAGAPPPPHLSTIIGFAQGICLPFRGLSRSGTTISVALLGGIGRRRAEEFSFALGFVLTPPLIALELKRLLKARAAAPVSLLHLTLPGLFGMACSFVAGLIALRLLSRWLEGGKWHYFGFYCLAAAVVVFALYKAGF